MNNSLPKPLKGIDGGFTYTSIKKRLPQILNQMISENKAVFTDEQLIQLKAIEDEIVSEKGTISQFIKKNDETRSHEIGLWKKLTEEHNGKTWFEIPW